MFRKFRTYTIGLVCLSLAGTLLQAQVSLDEGRRLSSRARQQLAAKKLRLKTGSMAKIGLHLTELYEEFEVHRARNSGRASLRKRAFRPSNPLVRMVDDRVAVEAVASGETAELLAEMEALGLENSAVYGRFVSGTLPVRALSSLAASENLAMVQPSAATTNVGLVTSQGDAAMNSDQVRSQFGIDGSGVRIGALSDSFDCLGGAAGDVASDDLPADIIVLLDEPGCGSGSDEGRAMMQLMHDAAPGSPMAFHTAFISQASFAQGIIDLATVAGSKVVVDDVIFFAEPMFQDGVIAQAVDAVQLMGVSYYSSAGNNGRDAYESPYRSSGIPGVFGGIRHDFDPGPSVDDLQTFIIGTGLTIFVFQWDQPFASVSGAPGSASDLDMILYLPGGIFIGLGGFAFNIGGDAVEVFAIANGGPPTPIEWGLELFAGPAPGFMKYVFTGPGSNAVVEFPTNSGSLYGHANANGASAVGAAFYANTPVFGQSPPLLEFFSSAGPTPIFFDTGGNPNFELRNKPEIVAPDGTNTTFFIPGLDVEPDGFPNFFGTSAAAPHAAAVAALIKQTNSGLSPDDINDLLEGNAVDMDVPGFDFDTGSGLIDAFPSVEGAATDPNKPKKRFVCHAPPGNPSNAHTISVSKNAVNAHLGHGDKFGPCADDH